MIIFSGDVVGSEGARATLRYQIMGSMLRFGPVGGFVTPNVNDLGHPLIVKIHRQCNGCEEEEHYVNLLEDSPDMLSKRETLLLIAKDPLSQMRFFTFCYQMFMMHVLGLGPVDSLLRHNGNTDGTAFPDGRAANLWSGATCSVACAHFPIEEQGRRSTHGHGLLIFNNRQSLEWFRHVLQGSTEEGREILRAWRNRVLASVESMQCTAVATVPLLLAEDPEDVDFDLYNPGYSAKQRETDKFDGQPEKDVKDSSKRRRGG